MGLIYVITPDHQILIKGFLDEEKDEIINQNVVSYHFVDFRKVSETIENMHLAFSSKKFNSYNQILVVGQL